MKRWLISVAVVLALLGVGGLLAAVSGLVPIAASSGHFAITEWFLQFSKQRSVATHTLGEEPPRLDDPALLLKGAGHFEAGCRPCHGAPDLPRLPRVPRAMLPPPPNLALVVPEYAPEELFYIVKHGIKFTGMPAWPSQVRDDEVAAMVAFLVALPQLDAAAYRRLVHGEPAGGDASSAAEPLDPLAGVEHAPRAVVASCGRCHGKDGRGRGNAAFPALAGQRETYLVLALEAYAADRRQSGVMQPSAAVLGADEMREIAAYYSRLPARRARGTAPAKGDAAASRPATSDPVSSDPVSSDPVSSDAVSSDAVSRDPAALARGRDIVERGVPDRRVPSCSDCHGPGLALEGAAAPVLAGQYADYLVLQLQLFARKERGGSERAHIMDEVAPRMTDAQMHDVAAYYESIPP
jgi:cytochrome c553